MSDEVRVFELRLASVHGEPENELLEVTCERLGEDGWQPYVVGMTGAPFAMFVYSAFVCQLAYLRMNAAERTLGVDRVRGRYRLVADAWVVKEITAEFWMHVRAGEPTDDDLAFIAERMRGCPISRNIAGARKQTVLHLEP
jgi:hypothetical protein